MVMYDFIHLPEEEKLNITSHQGTFLMKRDHFGLMINLYGVDDFYVEVWYHPDLYYIQKITAFRSEKRLEPYLDQIELSELIV